MSDEIDIFEADYEEAKHKIKENLSFLENEFDMMAILAWISRLEEPVYCPESKAIRNEYTKYLAHLLSRQTLHLPFTEEPPQGPLPPLHVSLDAPCGTRAGPPNRLTDASCKFELEDVEEEDEGNKSGFKEWPLNATQPVVRKKPTCLRQKRQPTVQSKQTSTCKPCDECYSADKPERSGLEKPFCGHKKCPSEALPCSVPPPPPPLPKGYLEHTTEENDGPFSPPVACGEESQARLLRVLDSVNDDTELYEFMSEVAPYTCDLGETMQFVVSEELAHFKEFVTTVYHSRMADTEELLDKEHIKLKARYEDWESNVIRQSQAALRNLRLMLPHFKYDAYKKDPEYLYYMLKNKMALETTDASPQARILRAKAQKRTWLNEEAQRIEKENMEKMIQLRELNAQLEALSSSYNETHKKLSDRNKCLEDSTAKLRIRHDENQKLIDMLIDQLNTPPKTY